MYPKVIIDSRKAANAVFRHPWIFSGAIVGKDATVQHGSLVQVEDPTGRVLGTGTFSASSSIAVRVFDFAGQAIDKNWFIERFKAVDERRRLLGFGPDAETTGYRVVFGESDGVPGLVVDRFSDVLVFQIATAGLDNLRPIIIIEALKKTFSPSAIFERSDIATRREENLVDEIGWRFGEEREKIEFKENGIKFFANVVGGQKTGFFLDQRDTRGTIRELAAGRKVLNIFSYTGAASVAALLGGAESVHNVDSSAVALTGIEENMKLNKIPKKKFSTEEADAFAWLGAHREPEYDLVIIDPPALIKSRHDIEEGKKAYHFLNRAAMRLVKDGGIFISSSCSHFLSEDDLAFILRRTSVQNEINLSILKIIRQAPDHPLSVYFPEAEYLKTFVCEVKRK
ncbi:MAG: class I SAM-dependent rRNA methyltransferase [Candidatus Uhrbacteria bacterium]